MSISKDSTYQHDLVVIALLENFKLLVNEQVHCSRVRRMALAAVVVLRVVVAIMSQSQEKCNDLLVVVGCHASAWNLHVRLDLIVGVAAGSHGYIFEFYK